jgi:hypothetical protein
MKKIVLKAELKMKNLLPFLFVLGACSSIKEPPATNLKTTTVEGKYEMSDCVEDWSIAQVEGLSNPKAQKKINDFLMSKISEKSCDHSEDVAGESYNRKITFDKLFPHFLAIDDTETFSAGDKSEPKVTSSCIVFNLLTGDRVEFETYLKADYQKTAEELVIAQIWGGNKAAADEYKHVLSASNKSIVEITSPKVCPHGDGLGLQFMTLEIAPANIKSPEVQVNMKTWPKLFKVNAITKELFGDK